MNEKTHIITTYEKVNANQKARTVAEKDKCLGLITGQQVRGVTLSGFIKENI